MNASKFQLVPLCRLWFVIDGCLRKNLSYGELIFLRNVAAVNLTDISNQLLVHLRCIAWRKFRKQEKIKLNKNRRVNKKKIQNKMKQFNGGIVGTFRLIECTM